MNINDFKKFVKNFQESNITADEPHVSMRCEENNTSLEKIKQSLINVDTKLTRIVEDRPKVYKLYCFLSKKRELKIVIDLFEHNKINIRTVKILNNKFRISVVKRQRLYIDTKQRGKQDD